MMMNKLGAAAVGAVATALALVATPLLAQGAQPATPAAGGKMSGMNMEGMSASDMAQMKAMMARMEKMMADCERMMKDKADAKTHGSMPAPSAPQNR